MSGSVVVVVVCSNRKSEGNGQQGEKTKRNRKRTREWEGRCS